MLNPYFILKNSMSENKKIYCRVYSKKLFSNFLHKFFFEKKKNHFLKENFNISKNNIISLKAAKLLVESNRKIKESRDFPQFIGLAYQGKKDIVFRFIIEYNSLRDFGPY
jgi:hypothetical protein